MVQTGESQLIRTRMVLLGASNLTRGIATVVATARRLAGPRLEVLAALGHGRSYGMTSSIGFGVRSLPGILECGLWDGLQKIDDLRLTIDDSKPVQTSIRSDRAEASAKPSNSSSDVSQSSIGIRQSSIPSTYALITDIGNDVLYGVLPEQITAWVEQCMDRLESRGAKVVMTLPPIETIRRVNAFQFRIVKSIMFPTHSLKYQQALQRADELHDRLAQLAASRHINCLAPRIEWYGFDPIHISRRFWTQAWREFLTPLLGTSPQDEQLSAAQKETPKPMHEPMSLGQRIRLRATLPERCRLLGIPVGQRQPVRVLSDGTTISLF